MDLEEEYKFDIQMQRNLIMRMKKCSAEEYPILKLEFNLKAERLETKWKVWEETVKYKKG